MANVARVEAVITAQDKLRPGLSSAARALESFRRAQSKATPIAAAERMLHQQAAVLRRAAGIAATYVGARGVKESVVRFADVDREMRRAAITGEAGEERIASATAEVRKIALETATPIQQVQQGLDSLTASGLEFEKSMRALPTVAKVAQATGSSVADIATTTTAAMDNFKITAGDLEKTYDILAKGGKLGKFELRDMARYLPSMLPAAKAVGLAGTEGMEKLVAMLQTVRLGSGSAEEAASSMANIFAKMESEETAKRFKKFGVDLRKEMTRARADGKDLLEVFTDLSAKALKGDLSKLPQLFQDMEFARGMRALLSNREKVAEFLDALKDAGGTINADFKRVAEDTKSSVDRLAESFDRAKSAAGGMIAAIGGKTMVETGAASLQSAAAHIEGAAATAQKDGAAAGLRQLIVDPIANELKQVRDERAALERQFDVGRARMDMDAADKRMTTAQGARGYRAERIAQAEGEQRAARSRFVRAVGLHQLDLSDIPQVSAADIEGQMRSMREAGIYADFEARRARQTGRGVAGGVPLPPIRPADLNGGGQFFVAPLDDVKSKAEEVKAKVSEIGPAGQQAGTQLATGLSSGLASMEAQVNASVDRMQAKLNSLKAPSLGGGFNTGRSMGELGVP